MSLKQPHPTAAGIATAYDAIDPVFLDSPLIGHPAADEALGMAMLAKVESLNPIRSFKGRGTEWFVANLPADDRALVAASAGNFGQGLAFAAAKRGHGVVMFAATTANPLKIDAMRRLGAEVILRGADFDAAKDEARSFAAERGLVYVEDGAEPLIAEGAGTMALEITRDLFRRGGALDAVLVPLGNGALLTGIGTWMRAHAPSVRVIGVVAEAAPSMMTSWREGRAIPTDAAPTIADGIAIREPAPYALDCMKTTVDDVWSVSEAAIVDAMRFAQERYGLLVEPAGAAGLAAAMARGEALQGATVATILCGGNLTRAQIAEHLSA